MDINRKYLKFIIFITFLLDMIGVGIIIPIVTPLVLSESINIPFDILDDNRPVLLAIIFSTFSAVLFFCAPISGSLADKYSHKKIITVTVIINIINYLVFSWAIYTQQLLFLWIARIMAGIAASNSSVLYSSMSLISTEENKSSNFGLLGVGFAVGFVIGPTIGGLLSDSSIVSWFNPSLPTLFACSLVIINFILVQLYFPKKLAEPNRGLKISPKNLFINLTITLKDDKLRPTFIVAFCYFSGFVFYTQFMQVFLIKEYSLNIAQIGYFFAYLGFWIVVGQGWLVRVLEKKFKATEILTFSFLVSSIGIFLNVIPDQLWILYIITPIGALGNSITLPNLATFVSNASPTNLQGQSMGFYQSTQSLANIIVPLCVAPLVNFSHYSPMIGSSMLILLAWILFLTIYKPNP